MLFCRDAYSSTDVINCTNHDLDSGPIATSQYPLGMASMLRFAPILAIPHASLCLLCIVGLHR